MKALTYTRYGGPEVIELTDHPIPTPAPNEVLVQVHSSAVNSGDWRLRAAAFPGILAIIGRLMFGVTGPRNPRMGSEFAGVISAVGAEVTRFAPGQRVYGMSVGGGASAEYMTIDQTAAIAPIPDDLSFDEAAALPFGGLCALSFLSDMAHLSPGQRLLIVGGSGGVGSYAVQIGKALGAHVTGVAGPDSQLLMASLGADATFDYRSDPVPHWGGEYDVILDTIGTLSPAQSRQMLRTGGVFLPLNMDLREIGAALLNPLRDRKIHLATNEDTAEGLERVSSMIKAGQLRAVIDSRYPLEQAAAAHARVETRHRHGSVVLVVRG